VQLIKVKRNIKKELHLCKIYVEIECASFNKIFTHDNKIIGTT